MKQQHGLSARARTRSLARGRDRGRARHASQFVFHHSMLGTQNIENFKLYRRPHQNIHLIFLFDNILKIMIPRRDTKI